MVLLKKETKDICVGLASIRGTKKIRGRASPTTSGQRGGSLKYKTKDSGKRQNYSSGMRRDLQDGKADFYLLLPKGVPYEDQLLTRWAELMERGKEKYGSRNWELACSEEELERFKSSAFRHFMQWVTGETDEDHAAAVLFNINAAEYVKHKLEE